jgi:hypothetical protein
LAGQVSGMKHSSRPDWQQLVRSMKRVLTQHNAKVREKGEVWKYLFKGCKSIASVEACRFDSTV